MLLLTMCAEETLPSPNTLFRLANKYKTTWMHPRSKQWHQIDYFITHRQGIFDVKIIRAMRGGELWTDHRLMRSFFRLHIPPVHQIIAT